MAIDTQKYIRKPLYVDAVRVTEANFIEISAWCQGEIEQEGNTLGGHIQGKKYIKVRVHNPKNVRQSKAYVGDWLLYTERGYKVYTNKAFHAAFDKVTLDNEGVVEKPPVNSLENSFPGMGEDEFLPREPPTSTVESEPEQEKVEPAAVEGKHVLSVQEQQEMTAEEIKDLVQSGAAVLAQDIGQA